jgi:hypothetical protein
MHKWIALVSGALALFMADAPQDARDESIVIAAAVSHLAQHLRETEGIPPGPIRFDPRVVESRRIANPARGTPVDSVTVYELSGTRSDSVTQSALTLLETVSANIDSARLCAGENLRSCTLRDGVAVFATSSPAIHADSAEVVVKAVWLGSLRKQPVQDGTFRVTLRRESSGWKAVATRTLQIS